MNRSSTALLGMTAALGVATVAALASNRNVTRTQPGTVDPAVGVGGGTPTKPTTTPKPTPTPKPSTGGTTPAVAGVAPVLNIPVPAPTAAPTTAPVPAGPTWSGEPGITPLAVSQRVAVLSRFLKKHQPVYWVPRPKECDQFAAALVMAAELEKYPLDLLVGHAWAEGALKPYMTPTAGSGAYGPTQVTAISCADVGMSYPPKDIMTACTVTIRQLRVLARRHSEAAGSLNAALRIYGMGYGNYQKFLKLGKNVPCNQISISVWRHEIGCSGAANRYTWKIREMTGKAAAVGLHTRPWASWRSA